MVEANGPIASRVIGPFIFARIKNPGATMTDVIQAKARIDQKVRLIANLQVESFRQQYE